MAKKQNWHNKGQKDVSKGRYQEPHFWRGPFVGDKGLKEVREYRKGASHARSQKRK